MMKLLPWSVSWLVLTLGTTSRAQDLTTQAQAESLFKEGVSLLDRGDYSAACERLKASNDLEKAPGTLINLADCYERLGKLASAWAAYESAAVEAEKLNRRTWAIQAQKKSAALAPRLSYLVVRLEQPVVGMSLFLDQIALPASALGAKLPLDSGPHKLEVRAPGYQTWSTTFDDIRESEVRLIAVPPFNKVRPPPPKNQDQRTPGAPTDERLGLGRGIALGVMGVGGVSLLLGSYFGLSAKSQRDRAYDDGLCRDEGPRTLCTPQGTSTIDAARDHATASNWLVGVGSTLLVGGAVSYWLVTPSTSSAPRALPARVSVHAGLGQLHLMGDF